MDPEHRTLMIKTRDLIEVTRHEISQLREEIQSAWKTIDQSQRLLSRAERWRSSSPFNSNQIEGVQEQAAVVVAMAQPVTGRPTETKLRKCR